MKQQQAITAPIAHQPWPFRLVLRVLTRLRYGQLTVTFPNGCRYVFTGDGDGPDTAVRFRSTKAMTRVLARGELGFAEGYMAGDWDTSGIADLLYLLHLNEAHIIPRVPRVPGMAQFGEAWNWLRHRLRHNSRRNARRNIAAHYDLGNAFYRSWLDETWTYSSAVFRQPDQDLAAAQRHKYDLLLDRLNLQPEHHLLELGCGWGGFALHAARRTGARVTGITLSQEQLAFARERAREQGLDDRVEFRLQDYRDVTEVYDRVASIEMYEAVGEAYWRDYFAAIRSVVAPGGRAAIQGITIDEASFPEYRRKVDFIQAYIFPGGMLASPIVLAEQAAAAGLRVGEPAYYGDHYAETLRRWHQSVVASGAQIRNQFDDRFLRMWRYYLAYCEAGFRSGNINLMQVTLERD